MQGSVSYVLLIRAGRSGGYAYSAPHICGIGVS